MASEDAGSIKALQEVVEAKRGRDLRIAGHFNALKDLRHRRFEVMQSVARIFLPLQVQSRIAEKRNLAYQDSDCGIINLELKAPVQGYGL